MPRLGLPAFLARGALELQSMSYTCQDKIVLLGYDVCGDSVCGVRLT